MSPGRNEESQENEVHEEFHTPRRDSNDLNIKHTSSAKNSGSEHGEMVYEQLADAFGFKKRYFSDEAVKNEHRWNRYSSILSDLI